MSKATKIAAHIITGIPIVEILKESFKDRRSRRECKTKKEIAHIAATTALTLGGLTFGLAAYAINKDRDDTVPDVESDEEDGREATAEEDMAADEAEDKAADAPEAKAADAPEDNTDDGMEGVTEEGSGGISFG